MQLERAIGRSLTNIAVAAVYRAHHQAGAVTFG
jgi:hypothetical protein